MTRPALAVLFAGLLGIPIGVGAFTFVYAKCFSYLSTHPRARVNCHVMNPHGIKAFKAKQGVADFDPNRDATRQESAPTCAASATSSTISRARARS